MFHFHLCILVLPVVFFLSLWLVWVFIALLGLLLVAVASLVPEHRL